MADENVKITTEKKEKDPKRVERGKKLAQYNKTKRETKETSFSINTSYLVGIAGLVLAVVAYNQGKKQQKTLDSIEEKVTEAVVQEEKKEEPVFDMLG